MAETNTTATIRDQATEVAWSWEWTLNGEIRMWLTVGPAIGARPSG